MPGGDLPGRSGVLNEHRGVRVTVLTPTFNRADTLPRVFDSLLVQTFRDFEWLVVDDGSTDETRVAVERFAAVADFPVRYVYQDNSGKHVALNTGVANACGDLCAVIDSDDWYLPHALEKLLTGWDSLRNPEAFAEVQALCAYPDGTIVGDRYPQDVFDSDLFTMHYVHRLAGDRVGAIRTDVLRQFPFPEEFGRVAVTEAIVWNRIARHYKTRGLNIVLKVNDYRPDGLSATAGIDRSRLAGPRRLYFKELATSGRCLPVKERLWIYVNWARNALLAGIPLRDEVNDAPAPLLLLAAVPLGWLLAQHDRPTVGRRLLFPRRTATTGTDAAR
jgi:glycosyltransferase involved in cell wall biosynthesis